MSHRSVSGLWRMPLMVITALLGLIMTSMTASAESGAPDVTSHLQRAAHTAAPGTFTLRFESPNPDAAVPFIQCTGSVGTPVNPAPGVQPPLGGVRVGAGTICTSPVPYIYMEVAVQDTTTNTVDQRSFQWGQAFGSTSMLITSGFAGCVAGVPYRGVAYGYVEFPDGSWDDDYGTGPTATFNC